MSVVENNIDVANYDQEVSYHQQEANYHHQESLKAFFEYEHHCKKRIQHADTLFKLMASRNPEVINAQMVC